MQKKQKFFFEGKNYYFFSGFWMQNILILLEIYTPYNFLFFFKIFFFFFFFFLHSEVDSSVEDNSPNGDNESLIETLDTIRGHNFFQTITSSVELSLSSRSNISSQSGSDKIEGIDEKQ
jgi:hypothetical protein